MGTKAPDRPRLTAKGERTRARIIEAAAGLIYERGVAGTSLDDIRSAARVSGSQLSHYFAGKDELVQAKGSAVHGRRAGAVLAAARYRAGVRPWRLLAGCGSRSWCGGRCIWGISVWVAGGLAVGVCGLRVAWFAG